MRFLLDADGQHLCCLFFPDKAVTTWPGKFCFLKVFGLSFHMLEMDISVDFPEKNNMFWDYFARLVRLMQYLFYC